MLAHTIKSINGVKLACKILFIRNEKMYGVFGKNNRMLILGTSRLDADIRSDHKTYTFLKYSNTKFYTAINKNFRTTFCSFKRWYGHYR